MVAWQLGIKNATCAKNVFFGSADQNVLLSTKPAATFYDHLS